MPTSLVTPPTTEPLTTEEAKTHLRVDIADDDTYIDTLIAAARQRVESVTQRQLVTATWKLLCERFPTGRILRLPYPPLASVTHIKYYDANGDQQTWSSDDYQVSIAAEPGKIVLGVDISWPTTQLQKLEAVEVQFVAGYGAASAVPNGLKQLILLLVGHWYENREGVIVGTITSELPQAIETLLWQYRMPEIL